MIPAINKKLLSFFLIIALFISACNTVEKKETQKPIPVESKEKSIVEGSFNAASGISFDSAQIQKFLNEKPLFKEFRKEFDTFYRANNYHYVWYDNSGLVPTSGALISSIENVGSEGVSADILYKDTLEQMLHNSVNLVNSGPDINMELMLTAQYFYYSKNIWAGSLNNKAESINWYLPRKKLSYTSLLTDNLSSGLIEHRSGPIAAMQYDGLKKALALYRNIDKNGDEIRVPLLTKNIRLKLNQSSTVIPFLRTRLQQLGDIQNTDSSDVYDAALAGVVQIVKQRYGLKPDSLLTNEFINEINVSAKKRAEQIMVNMERFRWIPADSVSNEFILVNIPEYTLHYFEDRKSVWSSNVVVGKPMNKTVIFSGKMRYVVFSPYWNIPTSIINKEIKPGMKKNPNYLQNHNMEWNGGNVRQKPGPRNSLGLVKFLFPNSNAIYLHDTPSKSLFNEDNRAFSHGCIRVEKPKDLAIRILKQLPGWTPEKIDAAMHRGKEQTVTLKKLIPVYIGYFTAFIDKDGQLNFRKDIYNRDGRLLQMLQQ
ncbi:MAG TPA: L,D-transpeptidase family protein [Hanamia sp.]